MNHFKTILAAAVAALICGSTAAFAQAPPESYPITLKTDDVREIAEWSAELNGLSLKGRDLVVVPIRCERGVTGAMLLGTGEFRFAPANGEAIQGVFRAAMLRFHPKDQPKLLPLDKTKVVTDHAAHEMSQHLLNNVFRHCWHSGMKALIPDESSWVANVYSKTHGDLLLSTGPKNSVAHNFTAGKTLYPKK